MTVHDNQEKIPLVFYDGTCGFCHQTVQFIFRRDQSKIFHFAPLQGVTAENCLPKHLLENTDSLVLLDKAGNYHVESTGVLKILGSLENIYSLLGLFLWIPRPIRDYVYRWVAKNRFRWFPKTSCLVPTTTEMNRFLP